MNQIQPKESSDRHRRSKLCSALKSLDTRINDVVGAMSPARRSALLMATSLFFASAMMAGSWFLESDRSQTFVFILIAIWWIPFSVLSSASTAARRGRCGK